MSGLRKWATPLTVGSFLVMGVTGTLMFFHLNTNLNKLIHEWAGWAMLVGVAAHLALNWRAFSTYFRRPVAMGIMGFGALMLAVSFVPVSGPAGGNPIPVVMRSLGQADLGTVFQVAGKTSQAGLSDLAAIGVNATADQSIADLAGDSREAQAKILLAVFD